MHAAGGRFEVDERSGVVRTRGTDLFQLDMEYVLYVKAEDQNGRIDERRFQSTPEERLSIVGGKRAPQFYMTAYEAEIPENQKKDSELVASSTENNYWTFLNSLPYNYVYNYRPDFFFVALCYLLRKINSEFLMNNKPMNYREASWYIFILDKIISMPEDLSRIWELSESLNFRSYQFTLQNCLT